MVELGRRGPSTTRAITQRKKAETVDNGVTSERSAKVRTLLSEFDHVINHNLEEAPPARVEPLEISLKPNFQSVWARERQ